MLLLSVIVILLVILKYYNNVSIEEILDELDSSGKLIERILFGSCSGNILDFNIKKRKKLTNKHVCTIYLSYCNDVCMYVLCMYVCIKYSAYDMEPLNIWSQVIKKEPDIWLWIG